MVALLVPEAVIVFFKVMGFTLVETTSLLFEVVILPT